MTDNSIKNRYNTKNYDVDGDQRLFSDEELAAQRFHVDCWIPCGRKSGRCDDFCSIKKHNVRGAPTQKATLKNEDTKSPFYIPSDVLVVGYCCRANYKGPRTGRRVRSNYKGPWTGRYCCRSNYKGPRIGTTTVFCDFELICWVSCSSPYQSKSAPPHLLHSIFTLTQEQHYLGH